ncbi:hypothetical protein FNV43_RR19475 [Rhamnella rubrinervis]|uniref:Crossover junction endonuclease MUS81 n=1 Tax=Rhamnella rubrinervis TaxID=2594499 RepID=A0A8K0DYL8_9ROSA|nr:hypothetical protein FNV43_RR19475 [Rhamnella rubrinervis]
MEEQRRLVACLENEELAVYMLKKWEEMAEQRPKGITENIEMTLSKAYSNLCASKTPIKTIKDFSHIKLSFSSHGCGKWILKLMQGFFETAPGSSGLEDLTKKSKKTKGTKRYMPQKNSVAYALLITLYRELQMGMNLCINGSLSMQQKQVDSPVCQLRMLIDPVRKGKGKPGQFGSSSRDWYSGWACMKTLITKGLVVKSSCPAKYMLTQEGQEAARECLVRSGLPDTSENTENSEGSSDLNLVNIDSAEVETMSPVDLKRKKSTDIPLEYIEKFVLMGYPKERILKAFREIAAPSNRDISSLWPSVLCRLREDDVYGFPLKSQSAIEDCHTTPTTNETNDQVMGSSQEGVHRMKFSSAESAPNSITLRACSSSVMVSSHEGGDRLKSSTAESAPNSFTMRACSSSVQRSSSSDMEAGLSVSSLPPLSFGERFEDVSGGYQLEMESG